MEFTVRRMTGRDVLPVARVAAAAANAEHARMRAVHDCGQTGDLQSLWMFVAANLEKWSDAGVAAVGEADGRVIGFAVGLPAPAAAPGLEAYRGDLILLGVLPEVEGMGVGSRLVCFVARALEQKDLLPMLVWTWDGSDRAQQFYTRRLGARGPLARKSVPCLPKPTAFDQLAFGWPEPDSLLELCDRLDVMRADDQPQDPMDR